jgi:hypothetical protein
VFLGTLSLLSVLLELTVLLELANRSSVLKELITQELELRIRIHALYVLVGICVLMKEYLIILYILAK